VQLSFCVRVSGGRLSDLRAVGVLRPGLWLQIIGHSCRLRTALGPLVDCLGNICRRFSDKCFRLEYLRLVVTRAFC